MTARFTICVLLLLLLTNCAYRPEEVADPATISLKQAVFEVADTLAATKDRTRHRDKVGLYVDEAVVTFNVAAKSTEATGLKLGASAPSGVVPLTASADYSLSSEGARGNTVTITFKNIATLKNSVPPKPVLGKPAAAASNGATPVAVQSSPGVPPVVIMGAPINDPALKRQFEEVLKNTAPTR